MRSTTKTITNLVILNGLQPPWDEGGAYMTAEYLRGLEGETFVLNRGPRHAALGQTTVVSVPFASRRLLKAPAYAAFALASVYYSLRLRPNVCHFFPLCAPGPLRQLHGLALDLVSKDFCEVLFQVRPPSRLFKAFSPFRLKVASAIDCELLSGAGFNVEYLATTPKARKSTTYSMAALRSKFGLAQDDFVVSHVGHLTDGRGLNVIVQAALLCPAVRFLLVLSSRKTTFDIDFPKNVTVLQRYIEDIHEIYALSNAYLFPLRDVACAVASPLTLLEAKLEGIPIICTDFPNLRATVGGYESAFFVPFGSVHSMAEAAARLIMRLASND